MTTTTDDQIVPYLAASQSSASQAARISNALEGDVQARLELLPQAEVESALDRLTSADDSDSHSILYRLQNPGPDETAADVLQDILETAADYSEKAAMTTALVWRYAQLHQLWKTHRNELLRTAEGFLNNLDQGALVRINIVVGTSTDVARRGSINLIAKAWGPDWYERVPASIRPPFKRAVDAPKRLLYQIAANCKQGMTLQDALSAWETAVQARTNASRRRTTGGIIPKAPYILATDVAVLNAGPEPQQRRRTVEMFMPELYEDRLELKPLQGGDAREKDPSKSKRKRSSRPSEQGGRKSKRKSKTRDAAEVEAGEGDADVDVDGEADAAAPPSAQRPSSRSCHGPDIVRLCQEIWYLVREVEDDGRCCKACEDAVYDIADALRQDTVGALLRRLDSLGSHSADE